VVHIKFAAKVNMRVFGDAISEQPGAQVYRAEDALQVLIVLWESASSKYGEFFFDVFRLNFN